jgi:hypothetical protein
MSLVVLTRPKAENNRKTKESPQKLRTLPKKSPIFSTQKKKSKSSDEQASDDPTPSDSDEEKSNQGSEYGPDFDRDYRESSPYRGSSDVARLDLRGVRREAEEPSFLPVCFEGPARIVESLFSARDEPEQSNPNIIIGDKSRNSGLF